NNTALCTLKPGVRSYEVKIGCDVNKNKILDEDEITQHITVEVLKVEKLTVTDAANSKVTATNKPDTKLVVCETKAGNAKIKIEAKFSPDNYDTKKLVLWKVEGDTAAPKDGDYTGGVLTVTLTPTVNNRTFIVKLGGDANANGVLDKKEVTNTITVTVVKIVSTTQKHAPDGITPDTRTTVGVCEKVTITINPSSISANWSVSGGGEVDPLSGTQTVFTADEIRSTSTITATFTGGATCTLVLTVIPPDGINFTWFQDLALWAPGDAGAGMKTHLQFLPLHVNFWQIAWLEKDGIGSNLEGYFKQFTPQQLKHVANPNPLKIDETNHLLGHGGNNTGYDKAYTAPLPKPWANGSFDWVIKNHYQRQKAGAPTHWFCDTVQHFTLDKKSGTATVTKGQQGGANCATCRRTP
ncbi:MAG: hypothetical protein V1899_00435, partial [Planctomycetota bacterium]